MLLCMVVLEKQLRAGTCRGYKQLMEAKEIDLQNMSVEHQSDWPIVTQHLFPCNPCHTQSKCNRFYLTAVESECTLILLFISPRFCNTFSLREQTEKINRALLSDNPAYVKRWAAGVDVQEHHQLNRVPPL